MKSKGKKISVAIYALHPITYQTPIFDALYRLIQKNNFRIDMEVLFGDNLSLKSVFYKELESTVKFDHDLMLDGFPNKFLKNYLKDHRKGFFSRINPGIIKDIIFERRSVILIHGYDTLTSWLAILCAKILFRKVIFRGEAVLEGNPYYRGVLRKIKHRVLPFFFSAVDAVMYSCDANRRYFEHYNVQNSKLFFHPCAVNNEFFIKRAKKFEGLKLEMRQELNIPKDNFVIFFCARFTARKRPIDLINAVDLIDNEKISIVFIGGGAEKETMITAAAEKEINVIFPGYLGLDDISKYAFISDIAVTISDKDPSPKSINEAMLFSLPIIVTDVVGTAKDLVKNDKNGYIIGVGDIQSLAEKIDYMRNHPTELKKMGKISRKIIESWNFDEAALGLFHAIEYVTKR